jgi:hypothetical protein
MSLSFVTKAIQTTAADGTFEETAVETEDDKKRGEKGAVSSVGLFDQLRQNKEEEEAARLEFQRSIMRGTLALDEDDAAHLQQLQRLREAEISSQLNYTEMHLSSFRAAQSARKRNNSILPIEERLITTFDTNNELENIVNPTKCATPFSPPIKIRKRMQQEKERKYERLPTDSKVAQNDSNSQVLAVADSKLLSLETNMKSLEKGVLSSLLSGYLSDENE